MSVIDTGRARHYPWGQGCDGWHLLESGDLGVIEERMPPGTAEQRHRHGQARQFFYVLAGEAVLEVEGVDHRVPTGSGLHVPPGAAHQMRNEGEVDVRFLVISAPPSHDDRTPALLPEGALS